VIAMSAGDVAALTGGRLAGLAAGIAVPGPVVIDSRRCVPGALFVCLPGEHTDGHEHAGEAFRYGAVAALAHQEVDGPAVVVDDVVRSLGFLAGGVLRRTTGCRVVGVTGSSGKTSTKDLIAAMLSRAGSTVAADASLNNEIGLPLTVLDVTESTRYLVLEYSARGLGHIDYLCRIAPPAIAVVLNVGSAHLGEFGSRDVVAAAKAELVEAVDAGGLAVLGVDDPLVWAMRTRTAATVMGFGSGSDADVRIESLRLDDLARPRFRLATPDGVIELSLGLSGAHHAANAAAAACVGLAVGMSVNDIGDALSQATAVSPHRMQLTERDDGLVVVDDAYNANPESVKAALSALTSIAEHRAGASWAVLGEMRELGDDAAALHAEVGHRAAELGVGHLVIVGDAARPIADGARTVAGWTGTLEVVAGAEDAGVRVAAEAGPADTVLVKASNAARLWRVAELLIASGGGSIDAAVGANA
jgi:UDP-N-acetylmuramoyl-tripeptide--D-alanyl-D-alanine ligase